jgi:drug/metabolite transporter (DMT)-like permease
LAVGFAAVYVSWGTTYLPTRLAIHDEHMPPLLFGGIRICCGGVLLLLYQIVRGAGVRLSAADFGKIMGVSALLFVAGSGLLMAANETVPSGVCAVLAATTPLWLGLFDMLWPGGDRLNVRGWLGLVIGLSGVLLLLVPKLTSPEDFVNNIGVVLMLGSAASWACGSLVLRHVRLHTSHLTTASYQMIFGGIGMTLVGCFIGESSRWPEHLSLRTIQAFLYLLVFGSLVGFVAFNWLLSHVAAAKVGTYAYVNPIIAVFVGSAAGEELSGWLAAGVCVILFGVFLVRGGERRLATSTPVKPDEDGISDTDWQVAQASEPS